MALVNASAISNDSPEYLRQVKRVDGARSNQRSFAHSIPIYYTAA